MTKTDLQFLLTDPRDPRAVAAMEAYYRELAQRLQAGFDVSLSADPEATAMLAPQGAFYVVQRDSAVLGCGGVKGTDKGYAEIKRVWIAPEARGQGLSRRLMAVLEGAARDLGITTLRLDSNSALPEAIALYRTSGWTEIARFNDDPYPDHFFEKHLS